MSDGDLDRQGSWLPERLGDVLFRNVFPGQPPRTGPVGRARGRLTEAVRSHSAPKIGHPRPGCGLKLLVLARSRARCHRPRPRGKAGTMSIAVMNWVWASSPASRDEGLVLPALADACSHDDGTGCWPSAATIARALTSATAPSAARSPGSRLTATWSCTAAAAGRRTLTPSSPVPTVSPCADDMYPRSPCQPRRPQCADLTPNRCSALHIRLFEVGPR